MTGFEPYAWRVIISGQPQHDGVPYSLLDCGPNAYKDTAIRAAIEQSGVQTFGHLHPGVAIASVRWYPLHDFGGGGLDPDDDGTDACGHGDEPDETCEGCYG